MPTYPLIILATRNAGKIREIRQILQPLPVHVAGLDEFSPIDEPEETGDTFAENARDKALYYAAATKHWCLADDSGLVVDALDGRPGVFSARYAAANCPADAARDVIDAANNAKLLEELAETPDDHRTARFVCHVALAGEGKILLEASDSVEGRVSHEEYGDNGFGYDPLFFIPSLGMTTAELPSEKKNIISHRGKAVRALATKLEAFLNEQD